MATDTTGSKTRGPAGTTVNGAEHAVPPRPGAEGVQTPAIVAEWRRAVEAKRAPFVMVADAHAALRKIDATDAELTDGAKDYYDGLYCAFVQSSGRLVQLQWPQHIRGGLALTAHPPARQRFIARLLAKLSGSGAGAGDAAGSARPAAFDQFVNADQDLYDLHAVYDYRGPVELLGYAAELDKMMIDTRLFIRGAPQRSAADTVYSCYADVLGSLDDDAMSRATTNGTGDKQLSPGKPKPNDAPQWPALKQSVADARALVDELAQRQAEGRYLIGAVSGLVLTLLVGLGLAIPLGGAKLPGSVSLQALLGCMMAGGAAAILSVLLRTGRGNLHVRWRVGWWMTFGLGMFRPVVGAISGGIAYLVLQSQLIGDLSGKTDAFYWAVAVLAGFSERFVPDMLTRSEDTLQTSLSKPKHAAPDEPAAQDS